MSSETIVDAAIEYAKDLFKDNSDGHGIDHAIRVYRNSQILMKSYPEADNFVVSIAALLHDVDDHKLFDTHNNANARVFLNQMGLSEEKIDYICNTINSVSFSQNYGKVPKTI